MSERNYTIHELIDWDLSEWPEAVRVQHAQSDTDFRWYLPLPIVCCRDCKHSHIARFIRERVCMKLSPSDDDGVLLPVEDDFFCGLGERKED